MSTETYPPDFSTFGKRAYRKGEVLHQICGNASYRTYIDNGQLARSIGSRQEATIQNQ